MNEGPDFTDEVTDVAKATQEVGKAIGNPISLLLGPSARVLGEHWAERLRAKISQKEQENLEEHIRSARPQLPDPSLIDITPTKIGALLEWTDQAKIITSTKTSNLASAWQLALADLLRDDFDLLTALPNIDEAALNQFVNGKRLDRIHVNTLKKVGFIDSSSSVVENYILALAFAGFMNVIILFYDMLAYESWTLSHFFARMLGLEHSFDTPLYFMFSPSIVFFLIGLLLTSKYFPNNDEKSKVYLTTHKGKIIINKLRGNPPNSEKVNIFFFIRDQ